VCVCVYRCSTATATTASADGAVVQYYLGDVADVDEAVLDAAMALCIVGGISVITAHSSPNVCFQSRTKPSSPDDANMVPVTFHSTRQTSSSCSWYLTNVPVHLPACFCMRQMRTLLSVAVVHGQQQVSRAHAHTRARARE
jgi:hypothetical protein